ncbi:MAG: hypothetical protein AAF432_14350 [Planctomycetota bacterium]
MASEARRGLLRIGANYTRLVLWLSLGLVLTPFMLWWVGTEAFGLIALVGASTGFARIFEQMTTQGMVREIAAAYHDDDNERFIEAYNSSFAISLTVACLALLVFGVVLLILPLLKIPETWLNAARWFVAAQSFFTFCQVAASPTYCMFTVREQFWHYAVVAVLERGSQISSALLLALVFSIRDVENAIRLHGFVWSGLALLVLIGAVSFIILGDNRLRPRPWKMRMTIIRRVRSTFGWNGSVHVAMAMHERLAQLIMNQGFNLIGNAVFELAMRLTGYVRMVTTGVTFGLDASSARVAENTPEQLRSFVHHYTRIHGVIAIPAVFGVVMLADPLLKLWLARFTEDADTIIPLAVALTRVLSIALVARAISDGWITMLYGAGFVRTYAPVILAGGVVSPIVSTILTMLAYNAWQDGRISLTVAICAPAVGYTTVFTLVHFFIVPIIGARCLRIRRRDLYLPLVRPALTTALCAPIVIIPALRFESWSVVYLGATVIGFALVYFGMTWIVVLSPNERRAFAHAIRRRISGASNTDDHQDDTTDP